MRKSLFRALVARIEVHDRDDLRPTYRLYDQAAVEYLETARSTRS